MFAQDLSDSELLGLIARRDEPALRELVERHSSWLLLRLRRRTPTRNWRSRRSTTRSSRSGGARARSGATATWVRVRDRHPAARLPAAQAGKARAVGEPGPLLLVLTWTAVVPATTAWALLRPFERHLAVFPYATTSPGGWDPQRHGLGALAVAVAAAVVLVIVLADARWWRLPLALQQ